MAGRIYKPFLKAVAEDIFDNYVQELERVNLHDLTVVFPNKRAGTFFLKYLLETYNERLEAQGLEARPMLPPTICDITRFFRRGKKPVANKLLSIKQLYLEYARLKALANESVETLDEFWSWGEDIINDFEDIDKQMANASSILRHANEYEQMQTTDYLTEEQLQRLKDFFDVPQDGSLKATFRNIWEYLLPLYQHLNAPEAKMYPYEGALYREVATEFVDGTRKIAPKYRFAFVGFNLISKAEHIVFEQLKSQSDFYWDYDRYYLDDKNQEACHAISESLERFPNRAFEAKYKEELYDNLGEPKSITYLSAPTENIQARYVRDWLNKIDEPSDETAIVLGDESLLKSVVNYLPEGITVNITAGYPLVQTVATQFVKNYFIYHCFGHSPRHYKALCEHPYNKFISKELNLFEITTATLLSTLSEALELLGGEIRDTFEKEAVHQMLLLVNQVDALQLHTIESCTPNLLMRITDQVIATRALPFEGEPLQGVQIMGMLETRSLDFKNVLILSCNDNNIPRGVDNISLLPYIVRKSSDLTTYEHRVRIQAYNFYRLMQRAETISLAYNSSTEDGQTGQKSRFMLQMLVERNDRNAIEQRELKASQMKIEPSSHTYLREEWAEKINELANKDITPSLINKYIRCPRQYFYNKIKGLREPDGDSFEDARLFGNVLHDSMEIIYNDLKIRGLVEVKALDQLIREEEHATIKKAIRVAFERQNLPDDGLAKLKMANIETLIVRLLEADKKQAPFTIVGCEVRVKDRFQIGNTGKTIEIWGILDRLDRMEDGSLRVIDYKTGGHAQTDLNDVESVFSEKNISKNHSDYYLQAMLYSLIVRNPTNRYYEKTGRKTEFGRDEYETEGKLVNPDDKPVAPALLFAKVKTSLQKPELIINNTPIRDIDTYRLSFQNELSKVLEKIFSTEGEFTESADCRNVCKYCGFKKLCNKQ